MSLGGSSYVQASPAELAQAQQQLKDWNALKPVFQKNATTSLARAEAANRRNSLRQGGISASLSQGLDAGQQQANYGLMQRGAAPTSGRFLMGNSGAGRTIGLARGLGRGVVNNESSYLQGLVNQINSGQSLLRGTDAARNALAGLDTQTAALGVMQRNANMEAIGTGIGAGIGAFGTYELAKPQTPQASNFGLNIKTNSNADWMRIGGYS